ncbi:MAG: MBL fold metallo-hydrolase [Candidatus Saccharimonadales bacterium]
MYILLCIVAVGIGVYIFFQVYAPFGGKTKASAKKKSANFVNGKFVNQIATPMNMSFADVVLLVRKQLQRDPRRKPPHPLTPLHSNLSKTIKPDSAQITWFGHSSFLLQVSGKNILLDPMFSKSPSPIHAIGPKRFSDSLPIQPEDLPLIDIVVISHDHYDHLDYASIKKLASKTKMFFVPLGLAAHLQKWGVTAEQITELDWWDERVYEGVTLSCTPSRHFSGRTLTDRFATLWSSWVIRTSNTSVFFSGDSGYGPHFKQIGDKYGPFDLTLLECGQYDPLWPNVHMTPEQTMQAHLELRGKRMIPMHWGAFVLAFHAWTDPVERVLAAGAKVDATVITPKRGEVVRFKLKQYPIERWWEEYNK